MLTTTFLALAWQGTGIPRPTGRNGYEEYLQASQMLQTPEATLLINWQPGMKPPARDPDDPEDKGPSKEVIAEYVRLNTMTPLEVRREAVRRFGRALDLIAVGNSKPVFDPRPNADLATIFPEFAGFKQLARLAVAGASVYAADGRTDLATKTLLDQLTFGDKFGRGLMIANLVGVAVSAISVRAFETLLPRMSLRDAETVSRSVSALLARPSSAAGTMAAEEGFMRGSVDKIFRLKPNELANLGDAEETADPTSKRMAAEYARLSPAARQNLVRTIEQKLHERFQRRMTVLGGPEKDWLSGLADQAEADDVEPGTLADYIVSLMDMGTVTGFAQANLRQRAQLRVLTLYAQATAYHWNMGKWPSSIDAVDPLNGEPFVYEVRADGTIRITSKGTKEIGEIGLTYRAPKPAEDAKP